MNVGFLECINLSLSAHVFVMLPSIENILFHVLSARGKDSGLSHNQEMCYFE